MKKLATLFVIVALGATIQSCDDQNFDEVENVVLEADVPNAQAIDDAEENEDVPGEQ